MKIGQVLGLFRFFYCKNLWYLYLFFPFQGALQFVQDTVAQSGVRLELEEIQPNAAFPVSQKILLTVRPLLA